MKHLRALILFILTVLGCASASTLDRPTLNSPSNGMDELTFHTSSNSAWNITACHGHVCRRAELRDGEQMEVPADVGSIRISNTENEVRAAQQRATPNSPPEYERLPRDTYVEVRSANGNVQTFRLYFIFHSLPGSYEFRAR